MKFVVTADMLLEQLTALQGKIYNALVERMELNKEKLTDAEKEALCYMACSRDDIEYIKEEEKKELFREFVSRKQIERNDIWWWAEWKHYYDKAPDENSKDVLLRIAVYGLIFEDCRYNGACGHYYNTRHSVLEIHEDYARVLGVDVEKVSSAISDLEKWGRIQKMRDYVLQYTGNAFGDLVDGVVYVPCVVYLGSVHNIVCLRRLQNG